MNKSYLTYRFLNNENLLLAMPEHIQKSLQIKNYNPNSFEYQQIIFLNNEIRIEGYFKVYESDDDPDMFVEEFISKTNKTDCIKIILETYLDVVIPL